MPEHVRGAGIQASEAQFRSFAEHSTNLLWIVDPRSNLIEYRSPAYDQIWGESRESTTRLEDWFSHVHPDDLARVRRAIRSVQDGEVAHVEYRIVRPGDGEIRWLRDTSFPIRDADGEVVLIGGIAEDLTRLDGGHVYVVGSTPVEARRHVQLIQASGLSARAFPSPAAFLDIAPFLAPGSVLVDLRGACPDAASITLELRARSIPLKAVIIGPEGGDVAAAVDAMKSGASDYLQPPVTDAVLIAALGAIASEARAPAEAAPTDGAAARLARLSSREREVLGGLVNGGTNKTIALRLRISPRTVELYRRQIMGKLAAANLAELLQLALTGGIRPDLQQT